MRGFSLLRKSRFLLKRLSLSSTAGVEQMPQAREERLQLMLSLDELKLIDDWRFTARMPSRAAAIRELLKRGLSAEGFAAASAGVKSSDFSVSE